MSDNSSIDSKKPERNEYLPDGLHFEGYVVEKILGRGGFGVVYQCFEKRLERRVAIKEYFPAGIARRDSDNSVHPSIGDNDIFLWGLKRFTDEARNLVKLQHPNVVRVITVFDANRTAYMVMDFEVGEVLSRHLLEPGNNSESHLKEIIKPIIDGIDAIHARNFLHRDVKPDNILMRNDGVPVVLDFGSARQVVSDRSQKLTKMMSPAYAPPEQSGDEHGLEEGPWTDIFALGGVLYYAINGRHPIGGEQRGMAIAHGEKDPLIPATQLGAGKYTDTFLSAIDWALSYRIPERPQTISEWRRVLLEIEVISETKPVQDKPVQDKPSRDSLAQNTLTRYRSDQRMPAEYNLTEAKPAHKSNFIPFLVIAFASVSVVIVLALVSGRSSIQSTHWYKEFASYRSEEQLGLSVDDRRSVQLELNRIGINVGLADGHWGPRTRTGIETWQKQQDLDVTGSLDEYDYRLLMGGLPDTKKIDSEISVKAVDSEPNMRKIPLEQLRARYYAAIRQQVENEWQKPLGISGSVGCTVAIEQSIDGEVEKVIVEKCTIESDALRQSVEGAVRAASPLPPAPDRELFDRRIRFNFRFTD